MFIGRTDVEAETPILWPLHLKSWLIGKDPDVGRDWGQEEKGMTQDEMAGWHHRHNGHEFEWTPGVGDGQGSLACCDSWGRKESDTTEWLNWTKVEEMADSILGHETYKKNLEYLSYLIIRKQRLLDPYQKNSESNLKRLLLAKVGTIWTLIRHKNHGFQSLGELRLCMHIWLP